LNSHFVVSRDGRLPRVFRGADAERNLGFSYGKFILVRFEPRGELFRDDTDEFFSTTTD